MKENLCTKYFSFTYKYIALNKKPPITKQNLHIFFFVIYRAECTSDGVQMQTQTTNFWTQYTPQIDNL